MIGSAVGGINDTMGHERLMGGVHVAGMRVLLCGYLLVSAAYRLVCAQTDVQLVILLILPPWYACPRRERSLT